MSEYEPADIPCYRCGKPASEFRILEERPVCKKCCRASATVWFAEFNPMKRKGAGPK